MPLLGNWGEGGMMAGRRGERRMDTWQGWRRGQGRRIAVRMGEGMDTWQRWRMGSRQKGSQGWCSLKLLFFHLNHVNVKIKC